MAQPERVAAARARARAEAPAPAALGELAVRLLSRAEAAGASGLIHVAASERRAERLAAILRALGPDLEVLFLPAGVCLPYDLASPRPARAQASDDRPFGDLLCLHHDPVVQA